MANENVENGNDREATSPTESKNASQREFRSKSSTIESVVEERADKVEDGTILNDEDVEKRNGESDKRDGVPEEDEKAITSTEKIERPSKDSRDASLEKASTSASKLTDVDDEGEQASMRKKKSEKQQVQKERRLRCGRQFRDIIGKQELRKEELEKREGDLRTRLDVLECSMPAVMVWNVWQRMSQGGPVPNLHRLMEKQFRVPAAGEICCPSTPSQHYDCRVREVEAERKEARRRLEEARELWLEKEARLKERREKLEEAKRIQEERKGKIERLTKEANELREALRKMDEEATAEEERTMSGACESGECGDIRCREGWLRKAGSVDSIKTIDVECLARLRELAESELSMKKQIAELERREETYMRTLQHADEMWSKMEGDTADTLGGLQDQLDSKTNVNQQLASRICELEDELEKLRKRMALCRSELTKYTSIEKIEAIIGREDDFAETTDRMVGIKPRVAAKVVGREDDLAKVLDKEILTKDELEDKETSARIDVEDKEVSPDPIALATGKATTEEPMEPEKIDEMHKYLAMLGSLEELYYDDDYGVCGPEYACNEEDWPGMDEEFSTTDIGSTSLISENVLSVRQEDTEARESRDIEESDIIPITKRIEERAKSGEVEVTSEVDVLVTSKLDEDSIEKDEGSEETHEEVESPVKEDYVEVQEPKEVHEEVKDIEEAYVEVEEVDDDTPIDVGADKENVIVPLDKLRSWVDTVDSIRMVISKCSTCSAVKDDADTLAEDIAAYAGVKAKEVITEIIPGLATIEAKDDEVAVEKVAIDSEMNVEETIPELVTEVEDKIETMPEVEAAMEEKPVTSMEVEPVVEPVIETLVDTVAEVIVEPVAEPAVEPIAETIAEPAVEPIVETIAEPTVEPIVETIAEPVIEPIVETISEPKVEPTSLISDKVMLEETTPEIEKSKEEVTETKLEPKETTAETKLSVDLSEKATELKSIDEEKIKEEITPQDDIATDDETIVVPIEKLSDEGEVPRAKEQAPLVEIPTTDEEREVEETKIDDEIIFNEDAVEERTEPPGKVEEIEVEKLVTVKTEDITRDTSEKFLEKPMEEKEETDDVPAMKAISEELESEVVPKLEIEETSVIPAEEPTGKIEAVTIPSAEEVFVDTEAEEVAVPRAMPTKEISETIEFKEEIPIEEDAKLIKPERVSLEEKTEEVEEKVSLMDEKSIEIEEVGEIKEEALMEKKMPILEEPEIEDIKEIVEVVPEEVEVRGSPPSIPEEKPEIKEKRRISIDPKIVPTPYLAVADIEEIKEEPPDGKKLPCVCKRIEETTRPPTLPAMQIVITQTEIVQTVVNRGTQTWTVHLTPIKVPDQRSMETDTRDPEISARKMRWRMRPKNRSAIPSSNVSSQTGKPPLVLRSTTEDPGSRDKQRLLSNILKSLQSRQSNEEEEIRSINYGQKLHETDKCDCCVCGKEKVSPRAPVPIGLHSLEKLPKTRLPKVDLITQDTKPNYDILKSSTKEKQRTSLLNSASASKSVKQVCDRGICTCAPSAFKSRLRTSSRKIGRSEKRDQSCLAKLSRGKVRSPERRKDEKYEATSCRFKCTKDGTTTNGIARETNEAANNPSNCMCTKTEKTSSGQLRKLQICACGDSD